MELVSVATAKVAWLFDIAELNPRGKSIFPEILEWLEEEYHFEKAPKSATDLDETKAFAFSRGKFQAGDEILLMSNLRFSRMVWWQLHRLPHGTQKLSGKCDKVCR